MLSELNRPATSKEIKQLVSQKYPGKFKESTIGAHLYGCSANNSKAYEHHKSQPKILWDLGGGKYELYDVKKHGEISQSSKSTEEKNHSESERSENLPFLIIDHRKYCFNQPKNEAQLEEWVREHSKSIFGEDSFYFDSKRQITSRSEIGSKPDGYAFCLKSKRWYVVEVELATHHPYNHILLQISKFLSGIANHDNQRAISDWVYNQIIYDPLTKTNAAKVIEGDIHYFLTNIISQQPTFMIIIDEMTLELEEACKCLSLRPDIV